MSQHSHYFRDIPPGITRLDIYRLLELFNVTDPVCQHIVKKAMVAGQRGHKDAKTDIANIRDSADRWLEMRVEDHIEEACEMVAQGSGQNPFDYSKELIPFTESASAWEEGEKRMDVVGQNGPTAEHYIGGHPLE